MFDTGQGIFKSSRTVLLLAVCFGLRSFYCDYACFLRCWLRHNDDRLLPGHILLHHHRVDYILPDRYIRQAARTAVADMWYVTALNLVCTANRDQSCTAVTG